MSLITMRNSSIISESIFESDFESYQNIQEESITSIQFQVFESTHTGVIEPNYSVDSDEPILIYEGVRLQDTKNNSSRPLLLDVEKIAPLKNVNPHIPVQQPVPECPNIDGNQRNPSPRQTFHRNNILSSMKNFHRVRFQSIEHSQLIERQKSGLSVLMRLQKTLQEMFIDTLQQQNQQLEHRHREEMEQQRQLIEMCSHQEMIASRPEMQESTLFSDLNELEDISSSPSEQRSGREDVQRLVERHQQDWERLGRQQELDRARLNERMRRQFEEKLAQHRKQLLQQKMIHEKELETMNSELL